MAYDDIDPEEEAQILALPPLNPDAPAKLGYPKDLCINLMDNFFKQQFDEYIKNITAQVDSLDQQLMYSVVHKLVGSSAYAGAIRVNIIVDKMQKAVPKDGPNPNFKRYKALYSMFMVECQKAVEHFDYYKKHGKLPEDVSAPVQPQLQQELPPPPPPKVQEVIKEVVVKPAPMKLAEIPKRVFPPKKTEVKPQQPPPQATQEEPSAKLNLTYNSAIGGNKDTEQSGGPPPTKPNIQQMKAQLLKQDVRKVPSVPPMNSTAYKDQPQPTKKNQYEADMPSFPMNPPQQKVSEANNQGGGNGGFVSQLDRVDSLFDKTINSLEENQKSEVKKSKKDGKQKEMGEMVAAPSFNKLDKNCPQSADPPVEEQKIEKKVLAPTSGLKFPQMKKTNNTPPPPTQIISPSTPTVQNSTANQSKQQNISPIQLQKRPLSQSPIMIEEEKIPKEAKNKDIPPLPKSPLSKVSEAGGKQKLKFNVHNQLRSTAGHHANRNDQGYWGQLNDIRKKIVQDLNIDGEEDQYPFDDGWKCSIF